MNILILSNDDGGLYKFRKELIESLVIKNYKVYVSIPKGLFIKDLKAIGCQVIINDCIQRRGTNVLQDLKLIWHYKCLFKTVKPDIVLTYTIKPNIYGGIICSYLGVPYISNVTGLGTSIENGKLFRHLVLFLYKQGLKNARKVFFQNKENYNYMVKHHVVKRAQCGLLPGSGVNVRQYCYQSYPKLENTYVFTTIGRIMRDKGINEILEAADKIKKEYPQTIFRIIGNFDEPYEDKIKRYEENGIIHYIPQQKEIQPYIASSHAIIHASYHEGMSNVLLEAASIGRPVIATNIPGCIETFVPDVTGIAFKAGDSNSLIQAIKKFIALSYEEKVNMGKRGRKKIVKDFNRNIVIVKYMKEIENILEETTCL